MSDLVATLRTCAEESGYFREFKAAADEIERLNKWAVDFQKEMRAAFLKKDAEIERLRSLLVGVRARLNPDYKPWAEWIARIDATLAGATVQPNDDMGSSDSRASSRGTDPAGSEARNGLGVAGAIPAPCRTGQPSATLWTGCAFLGPPPAGYDAWSSWVNAPVKTGVEIIAVTANPTPAPQPKAALSLDAWLDLLPVGDWYGVTVRRGANGIERITVEVTTNPTTEILSTTAKGG